MILNILIPFAILAVGLILAYSLSRHKLRSMLASQSKIIQTTAGPVEYFDIGTGPVILHAHGMLGGFDHWKWCQFFVRAGYRVIVPSRPGYLRTPLSSGRTPAEQAALYAALLDSLDIDQAALYAYSQGGASALQFAWTYPERCWGLILFSALTKPQPELEKILPYVRIFMSLDFLIWLLRPVMLPWIMSQAKKELLEEIQRNEEKMAAINEIFSASFQASLRGKGLINDFNNTVHWEGLQYHRLVVPVLILHGGKDAFIKREDSLAAAAEIPGAKFVSLDEAGHEALVAWIDQIEPEVLNFLKEHILTEPSVI